MVDFDDSDINLSLEGPTFLKPENLVGWAVRQPSARARRWSMLSGLVHGLVWAFPFVMIALVWRRISGSDGNPLWPSLFFAIGMILLILLLIKGILSPRTWWFAYTDIELIVEHGLLFRARDNLAFERVQYLERRAGPIMRPSRIASLEFETAAGRALVPAAELADIEAIEEHVRIAMQRATVV